MLCESRRSAENCCSVKSVSPVPASGVPLPAVTGRAGPARQRIPACLHKSRIESSLHCRALESAHERAMAPWWLPALGLLFVAAGLWLACSDEGEDSTEEEVEEDEEEQYDDKMSSRRASLGRTEGDDSRPSRGSDAYWQEPGDARMARGWLLLVSGFVLTWLLAVLVALPVTAKLLALAAPGCLIGLVAAKHVGTGGDKWMLVPITLLWLWCAAVPFLDHVTWWHRPS
ncbi:unnamed protein product [Symbiodinium sp. CCMP2592]|nr:unnamed protein product [Symbiodinium sp. CCMP2592]